MGLIGGKEWGMQMKKEMEDILNLCQIIEDEVLRKRMRGSMEWYMNNAVKNRGRFYVLSFMTIVMPLLTTLVNSWEGLAEANAKNMVSLCSMLAALAASALCLLKCQEKWILYRSTVEKMKRLLSLYRAGQIGNAELTSLVQELENCMDEEHTKWREMREMQKDNKNSNGNKTSENGGNTGV